MSLLARLNRPWLHFIVLGALAGFEVIPHIPTVVLALAENLKSRAPIPTAWMEG